MYAFSLLPPMWIMNFISKANAKAWRHEVKFLSCTSETMSVGSIIYKTSTNVIHFMKATQSLWSTLSVVRFNSGDPSLIPLHWGIITNCFPICKMHQLACDCHYGVKPRSFSDTGAVWYRSVRNWRHSGRIQWYTVTYDLSFITLDGVTICSPGPWSFL